MSLTLCFPQKLQARAAVSFELLKSCSIAPRILINIEQPPAILIKNRPQGRSLKIKSGWKPLGISYFSNDVDVELSWEKFRSSSTQCIKVSEIKISIGAEPPQIWIAPEVEKNKCLKEQVLRHELQHVSNRHKFYNHLKENLHHRLLQLGSDEVFEIITSPAHQSRSSIKISNNINKIVNFEKKSSLRRLSVLDRKIDTVKNYLSILSLCE